VSVTSTAQPGQPAQPGAPAQQPVTPDGRQNGQQSGLTVVPAVEDRTLIQRVSDGIRSWLSGTPGRMRLLMLAGAVTAIVFGIAAAQGFAEASGALDRADANTAQLVRIQEIHTNLARADADATNAFLRGGLEPPAQRQDYLNAMSAASGLIADAARSQPADNQALAALNQAVVDYSGLIEQARANNRQGLPVGAQYLRVASSGLRADALPLLQNLVKANQDRVELEFDRVTRGFIWLSVAGLLALAVFGLSLVWLARSTHRYVNVPVAIGGIAVLLTTVIGAIGLSNVGATVGNVHDGPYTATLSLAQARIAAYDAKSQESLTLISRGSGQAFETAWKASSEKVKQQLGIATGVYPSAAQLPGKWDTYVTTHQEIRALDDGGDWNRAVEKAIGNAAGSANSAFNAFDSSAAQSLSANSQQTRSDLSDAGNWLPIARWLSLLIGIAAALCVFWGFWQRLEEYR
jgi:hypothetical protein